MDAYEARFGQPLPGRSYWNRRMETLSPGALDRLNERRLRAQVAYLRRRSKFYRRKLREAELPKGSSLGLRELERIPFTTKAELRTSLDAAPPFGEHLAARRDRLVRVHASSGTTGRPTLCALTGRDREMWKELSSRGLYTHGIRRGDVIAFGYSLPLFVAGLGLQEAFENIGATFVPTSAGMSERLVGLIQQTEANVLVATPSYALYLAEFVEEKMGLDARELGIRKIKSGAEPGVGIPSVRARIEEAWGAMAVEGMGNADVAPTIFCECPYQNGMHFSGQGLVLVELIDPDGGEVIPLEDGASGELVYTSLEREASPVLRFRSGDVAEVAMDDCPCGRTGFRVRCFGRTDEMLKVRGVKVWPTAVQEVVASFTPRTTGSVQLVLPVDTPSFAVEELVLQVEHEVGSKREQEELRGELQEAFTSRLFVRPRVELVPKGSLPRSEMKSRLVRRS